MLTLALQGMVRKSPDLHMGVDYGTRNNGGILGIKEGSFSFFIYHIVVPDQKNNSSNLVTLIWRAH